MDVGVWEESEVENRSAPGFGEDGADSILGSLCDSKEYVAARRRELPAQLPEHAVGDLMTWGKVAAALGLRGAPGLPLADG